MESCFPPLAGLSLRDGSNAAKSHKNRHSTSGTPLSSQDARNNAVNSNECMPKLEVLQDLDLYYIRQIASSLKVKPITYTLKHTHRREKIYNSFYNTMYYKNYTKQMQCANIYSEKIL